jgi:hypothetical protein
MRMRVKRHVQLSVEQLEERCVPAYLVYSPQEQTVRNSSNTGIVSGFVLQADIMSVSDRYQAPNGQRQVVQSVPTTFTGILTPTQAEWDLLLPPGQPPRFPGLSWASSTQTLADNSFIITDAEALDPSRQTLNPRPPRAVGQSLFIRYTPNGVDPPAASIHWLQFVTTNTAPFTTGGAAGTPGIDNEGQNTPFYDTAGAEADRTGFCDVPSRRIQNALITWHADLFLVQDAPNGGGGTTEVEWQGVSWGWQTVVSPDRAPRGFANRVTTPANTAYVFAPADFGFTDADDSPPDNFHAVKVTTLPSAGTLTDNGVPVHAGDFVSVSDITSGLLVFTPATNAIGTPYTSFTFQVQDDGGTADGGVDTDPTPRTMTIDVTRDATTISLTSSLNPAPYSQPVTFTATVAPSGGAGGTPTGVVDFYDNGVYLGSATLSNGVASFTISTLAVGQHSITAFYEGDNVFGSSFSDPLTQTVQ